MKVSLNDIMKSYNIFKGMLLSAKNDMEAVCNR